MTNRIQGTTRLLGLLGYPVKHSKSPQMHNTAFEALELDYVYMAFGVKEGFMKDGLDALKTLNAVGANITMPLKTEILEYLDDISEDAMIIGSVNTIKIEDGKIKGYNTDGKGFVKALQERGVDFKGRKIVIAGAGGAARAVATQLAFDGAGEIVIVNRTLGKAREIIENISKYITSCKARALEMDRDILIDEIHDAAVLVNCTSLGMETTIDQAIISSPEELHKDLFVADIIYDPEKTKLLKIAEEAGCNYMNGLGMILWQGAIAFKIWTGQEMPIDLIKNEIFGK